MSQSQSLWACLGFPRFDWRLAGGRVRVDSPFELFLERRERGESWGLAQPLGSSDGLTLEWVTYPLPLDPSLTDRDFLALRLIRVAASTQPAPITTVPVIGSANHNTPQSVAKTTCT